MTAPAPLSNVYSEADMRMQLATVPSINAPCIETDCALNQEFDQQVQQLGVRLAAVAFDSHPELSKRISRFEFVVAEKKEPGSISNAKGTVVIFRDVQKLHLHEDALAFLIAREMGHVIARHHDENSATRIAVSVLAGVLFPAFNLFNGSAAAAQATSATSVTSATTFSALTTAASTATSYIGSKVVLAHIKPDQLREADSIALDLLERLGLSRRDVASALEASVEAEGDNAWVEDFRLSVTHVKAAESESMVADADLKAKPLETAMHDETFTSEQTEAVASIELGNEGVGDAPGQAPSNSDKSPATTPVLAQDTEQNQPRATQDAGDQEPTVVASNENMPSSSLNISADGGEAVAEADVKKTDDKKLVQHIAVAATATGSMGVAAGGRGMLAGSKSGTTKRDAKVSARSAPVRLAVKGVKRGIAKIAQVGARQSSKSRLPSKSIKTAQANKGLETIRSKSGVQQSEPLRSSTNLAGMAQNKGKQERLLNRAANLLKELEIKNPKKAVVSSNNGTLLAH